MFSARKAKPAARHPQQSVAPQIESSTTGSSRQIERSTTGSSLDDSNESSRRGDVALCCAYVLQGSDWAPVNNSRPDDLSGESRFLAAKIVQDEDMAEAFLELHDYPQTTIIELVVKLKAESRLVKLGGARNAKAHVYELERCCGPDVVVGGAVGEKTLLRAARLSEVGAQGAGTAVHAARRPRAERARSKSSQEVRAAPAFRRRLAPAKGRVRRGVAVLQGRAVPGLLGLRVAGAARAPEVV